jgi:hypothetical protein
MRVLSPDSISERLNRAGFEASPPEQWGPNKHGIIVQHSETGRGTIDEIELAVDVLAGGYRVEVNDAEGHYEVVLQEDG